MSYEEFSNKIAAGMGLKAFKVGEDFEIVGEHGKRHWVCGSFRNEYWAESCFNFIVIMSWNETQFAVVENGTGPTGGPDEQIIHRIGTLRQCINTAKKLYTK